MDETWESAAEYFQRSADYQLKSYEKLIDKIPFKDTDHVFDLGCGTAEMSARMANEIVPNGQVTACNPEKNRIRFAEEKFSDIPNLHFIHAKGSEALKNRADLYDVIVSNGVFHWMTEDELRKTMVNMFNALKIGGIAAINFIADIPSTYYTLGKIEGKKMEGLLEILHIIDKEKLVALTRKVGFVTTFSESYITRKEFDTVSDLLRTADASTYGLFGWEKLFNDAKSRGLQVNFDVSDTGKSIETFNTDIFIWKKP